MLPWLIIAALVLCLILLSWDLWRHIVRLRLLEDKLAQAEVKVQAADADPLTGLLNRTALDRRLTEDVRFSGVVIVIDLDNFKALNDSLGHLTGDEILHNIGKLIQASIREDDTAFRWGGDEFVILFRNSDEHVANLRMRALAERTSRFQLRARGPMPLHFSWGTAPVADGSLREALEEADRIMLQSKRARSR
jgi:diguanylate cyclase (GGDEF)-like protein